MAQATRHYGFAQVPRDVTRGKYKQASLVEKGLYACLKDICGDEGECFYTFRNLAKEVNTSISTLSRYIPKLVELGLITAEKKPGRSNNHEIYHITIVNIWQENDTKYKPQEIVSDRNNLEETVSSGNNSKDFVSDRNNSVSNRNNNSGGQAQDCFNLNGRIRREEDSLEEEGKTANAAPNPPTSKKTAKPTTQKPVTPKVPEITLTEQQKAFWQLWCNVWFNKDIPPKLNETAYGHTQKLAPHICNAEHLNDLITYTRKDLEQRGIKQKTVALGNLVNSYSGWKQTQPIPFPSEKTKYSTPRVPMTDDELYRGIV